MTLLLLLILISVTSNILTRKVIKGIDYIDQTEKYPTGCESISTVMCLNYHKIDISPTEFIDNYIEKGKFILKIIKNLAQIQQRNSLVHHMIQILSDVMNQL